MAFTAIYNNVQIENIHIGAHFLYRYLPIGAMSLILFKINTQNEETKAFQL